MDDRPRPSLDPDRLKEERHDVDLGTEEEAAGHDHLTRQPGHAPDDTDASANPTSGPIPPAR